MHADILQSVLRQARKYIGIHGTNTIEGGALCVSFKVFE